MSIEMIKYSCGHSGLVELPEDGNQRVSKLNFYENKASCPDCYAVILRERDKQNSVGCVKFKMSDKTYKSEFSDCKFTKVGLDEPNKKIVFVPLERATAMAVLKCLGVKRNSPDYQTMYDNVIKNYLYKDTSGAREKLLLSGDTSENSKARMLKAFDIIDEFQKKSK